MALATLAFPVAGQATLLFGVLNIGGSVNISTGRIDFVSVPPSSTSGTFLAGPSAGDFSVLNGTMGTEKNIDNPPYMVNTTVVTPNFITFAAAPNISFTLMVLLGGNPANAAGCSASPPAANQVCTPNTPNPSPFNLMNTTAQTSSATFTVTGTENDSLTGTSTPITGIYTAQFGVPFQSLLATINGGGTINTTYSATFVTSTVPEPSSALTFGCGALLLGLGATFRRFSRLRS